MILLRVFDWMEETSPLKRWSLLVLLACLIVCLFYWGAILPREQSLREMVMVAQSLTAQIAEARLEMEQGRKLQREIARWEQQIRHYQSKGSLPERRGNMVHLISEVAVKNDVEIVLWKPLPVQPVATGFVVHLPIMLTIEGTFHHLVRFLDQLRSVPTFLTVRDLTMQVMPNRMGQSLVQVSCQLVGHTLEASFPLDPTPLMVVP